VDLPCLWANDPPIVADDGMYETLPILNRLMIHRVIEERSASYLVIFWLFGLFYLGGCEDPGSDLGSSQIYLNSEVDNQVAMCMSI